MVRRRRVPAPVERGRAYIESLGLRLKVMPNALAVGAWAAGTAQERVDLIDFDLVRANPKVFQGLSDITVLHSARCEYRHVRHAGGTDSRLTGPSTTITSHGRLRPAASAPRSMTRRREAASPRRGDASNRPSHRQRTS